MDGRGTGHLWISRGSCHDQLRSTTFYKPLDITHRQVGPWQVMLMPAANSVHSTCPKER